MAEFRVEPAAGAAEGPWVELRIHGVSGTPPEAMLESAHVCQVAGDAWGRIFRPVDGVGREVQTEPGRTLEGYHWGKYTSGSWVKGLWLILLPFGLVNAAAFMVPQPGDASWLRRLHGVVQAVIRGIGIGVTGTFALASGLILVDLVAWQWAAGLPWLTPVKSGYVMTVGVLLAGIAVAALFQLGNQNRASPFGPKPPSSLAATFTSGPQGLLSSSFFRVDEGSAPVLGRLHLGFGWCVVALIGALTWKQAAGTRASDVQSGLQHLVYWLSLALLVAIALVVAGMGDPNRAVTGSGPPTALEGLLAPLSKGAVVASGIALGLSAGLLATTDRQALTLDFDAYAKWLAAITGLAMLVLAVLLGLLAWKAPQPAAHPRAFRRYAKGMAAWAASSVGVFLGVGFCAAFVLGLARTLHARAQTELIYRVAYSWGLTTCLLVVLGLGLWVKRRLDTPAMLPRARAAYSWVGKPGLGAPGGSWPRTIAGAMSTARLKGVVAPPVVIFAAAGLAMTAVTSIEMLGEARVPVFRSWYQNLWWFGYLSEGLHPVPPTNSRHATVLINLGTYSLIALAGLLFYLGRRSLRTEQTRRGANVAWDVISFWPHSAHPFVPPAYSQFAVHDLRRRIRFHLGLPLTPSASGEEAAVDDDAPFVVVSAHSQGSLIAFATMLWLSDAERAHVGLVTYGSQLQVAYPRGFPAYLDLDLVAMVRAALGGRWINLYRETDPIAGPVLSWDRSAMTSDPPVPDPPTSCRTGTAGRKADGYRTVTGRRESGGDWRVLDPAAVDDALQLTELVQLSKHSGYPAGPDYPDAVRKVRT